VSAVGLALLLPAAASAPPLPTVHPKAKRDYSAVLMWHDVVEKRKEVWFDTTVAELEAQFQSIKRAGLTPVTLDALAGHLETGSPIPKGAVVLTFDDNNLGLYRFLYPMLKRYRWPAVLFVHTAYVGKPTGKPHCTWEQLREMEASGLVKTYPHTVSHPEDMRKLTDAQLAKELVQSRKSVEKHLGGDRRHFSYSNGFYDDRVARAAAKAGYRLAITEDWGAAQQSRNLLMLRRYSMHKRAEQAVRDVARAMPRVSR
jgi:peptidoglycan/xylan/chitin deacetylase (PgdA/CDA1 family)